MPWVLTAHYPPRRNRPHPITHSSTAGWPCGGHAHALGAHGPCPLGRYWPHPLTLIIGILTLPGSGTCHECSQWRSLSGCGCSLLVRPPLYRPLSLTRIRIMWTVLGSHTCRGCAWSAQRTRLGGFGCCYLLYLLWGLSPARDRLL